MDRRDFLKTATVAAGAAATEQLLTPVLKAAEKTPEVEETRHKRRHCQSESVALRYRPRFERPAAVNHRPAAPGVRHPRFSFGAFAPSKSSASDSGPRIGSLLSVAGVIGEHFSQLERGCSKKVASLQWRFETELRLIGGAQEACSSSSFRCMSRIEATRDAHAVAAFVHDFHHSRRSGVGTCLTGGTEEAGLKRPR